MAHKNNSVSPRRRPTQARSKSKVAWLLEAAARVFRVEGYAATTNRIAEVAGVSIGSLYEYFPNKEALLLALAEHHVTEAESGIGAALKEDDPLQMLTALQRAVLASQRYPSTAIAYISDPRDQAHLKRRVAALREQTLSTLEERAEAAGAERPKLRARIVFGLVGELTCATFYEPELSDQHAQLAHELLELAFAHFIQRKSNNQ